MEDLTVSASHEYYEWATDPFPQSAPAYTQLDDEHWAWSVLMIGELGDLCTFQDRENLTPSDMDYVVQRQWSNKLSLAGKHPCAPVPSTPYVQAVTIAQDDISVPDRFSRRRSIATKAVRLPLSGERDVDVVVYADRPLTDDISLRAVSYSELYSHQPSGFTYTLKRETARAKDVVTMHIEAPSAVAYDVAVVTAELDGRVQYWPVLVVAGDKTSVSGARAELGAATASAAPSRIRATRVGLPR